MTGMPLRQCASSRSWDLWGPFYKGGRRVLRGQCCRVLRAVYDVRVQRERSTFVCLSCLLYFHLVQYGCPNLSVYVSASAGSRGRKVNTGDLLFISSSTGCLSFHFITERFTSCLFPSSTSQSSYVYPRHIRSPYYGGKDPI